MKINACLAIDSVSSILFLFSDLGVLILLLLLELWLIASELAELGRLLLSLPVLYPLLRDLGLVCLDLAEFWLLLLENVPLIDALLALKA